MATAVSGGIRSGSHTRPYAYDGLTYQLSQSLKGLYNRTTGSSTPKRCNKNKTYYAYNNSLQKGEWSSRGPVVSTKISQTKKFKKEFFRPNNPFAPTVRGIESSIGKMSE